MRFEIVSAPLEERLQHTLQAQAVVAIEIINTFLLRIRGHHTDLHNTFSDPAVVAALSANAATLLMPSSLPGSLFVAAVFLKGGRMMAVRALARRRLMAAKRLD